MARFLDAVGGFFAKAWTRLEAPLTEIFVHVVLTIAALLGIAVIDQTVRTLGLVTKTIPGTPFLLSDWLFILEVLAVTLIVGVGIYQAIKELAK